jgi:type IV pilus assembly protein PilZ
MADPTQFINCVFSDENSLYVGYMPFIKDGGLFIHTKNIYELGHAVTLSLTLMDEAEQHIVEGKVVWITPRGAQGNKPAGIGVQFVSENKRQICNRIETYLAGKLKSVQQTDTM